MLDGICEDRPMAMVAQQDLTALLNAAHGGDAEATDAAWRTIYGEMHAMARGACKRESSRVQLQPTLIVHETFLKMFAGVDLSGAWDDRRHFWGSVSRAMGQYLVDLARSEGRLRRGGGRARVPLEIVAGELADPVKAVSPEAARAVAALERLEQASPEAALVARIRYFQGCSVEETARLSGIAPRTVNKRWTFARAWLLRALAEES
jgi:RNA polymerase sigma factor (TIGR02999 family)